MKLKFTLSFFLFVCFTFAHAQVAFDNTFDTDGKASIDVSPGSDKVSGAKLQSDGKIVVVGNNLDASQLYYQPFVARFNANGSPDLTFNGKGFAEFNLFPNANEYGYKPEVLSNGKILVAMGKPAGFNGIHILRLNSDGTIDNTFGTNGLANHPAPLNTEQTCLAIQTDGKIVIGGVCNNVFPASGNGFFVARFNSNGSVDSTFNGVGYITDPLNNSGATIARKLLLGSNGNIYMCGASFQSSALVSTIMSVTSAGVLNTGFDFDGFLNFNFNQQYTTAEDMVFDNNGKLIVCGTTHYGSGDNYRNLVFRLNANGSLDNTFNSTGSLEFQSDTVCTLTSVLTDFSNKIILGGSIGRNIGASKMVFYRLNPNGSIDYNFNTTGRFSFAWGSDDYLQELLIQPDGKLIGVGDVFGLTNAYFNIGAVRLSGAGASNFINKTSLNSKSVTCYPNPFYNKIQIQLSVEQPSTSRSFKIFNLNSKTILEGDVTGSTIDISTQDWHSGIYLLEVQNQSGCYQRVKLIKY